MKLTKLIHAMAAPEPVAETPSWIAWITALVTKPMPPRSREGRFYPSDTMSTCPRAQALGFLGADMSPVSPKGQLSLIFAIGNSVHELLQNLFEKVPNTQFWTEVPITPDKNPWFFSGRMDGIMLVQGKHHGVEIKSINKDGFGRVWTKPQDAHLNQATVYYKLFKLDSMTILYFCKDNSALKEFVLPYDPDLFEQIATKIEYILVGIKGGYLPMRCRPDCHDSECQYREACWNDAHIQEVLSRETNRQRLDSWVPVYLK